MITMSPVTAAKPRRSAAPLPAFCCRSSVNVSSRCSVSRISEVPSLDPSSTTISSRRSVRASTRRTIASIVVRSLYTGITTDRSGSVLIIEGFTVPYMNRLVILAPNWLGDAVMALPAIADVRRAAPAASITVAARGAIAPVFAMAPDVDETLTLGDDEAETLAAQRFDTALLLPNSTRAAIVARRAGIADRWGYRTGWRGALLTRAIPTPRGVHQIEYYQHLARALGFSSGPAEPRVTVSREARDAGLNLLMEAGWNGQRPLALLAPGAAYGGAKRWPPEYFAELADGLAADGVQCVIVGTRADAEPAAAGRRPG